MVLGKASSQVSFCRKKKGIVVFFPERDHLTKSSVPKGPEPKIAIVWAMFVSSLVVIFSL